ncbi:bifunctional acetate--CoA ligase family protein/GNAT family N-acetyltransferase [Curvibacter sp. CHRR-16]|uniref:bifunctional acetate--CoA ligase family protein/GNAT family N-acetyltransferase n=1 Tax=Curvibacter sp. CHRR-16 TaxID=2835872 RepID=UPI001BDA6C2B|nr:bifunctional acetate--CoA ligase family protein/GNAT family N-acetyltransferase [Curvibacter sp. CHRR-16]MBT0571581.1 bifunctional acetate--CoA ligase family protein/GNAT family N-acetyltransferase [Curvibacter sp. CHRR-16]
MDKHFLTPLFSPKTIAVFTGSKDRAAEQTPQARALAAALKAQTFQGKLLFLDIGVTGTLADLAKTRADLALIALPPLELPAALELAARIGCKAAIMVGTGIPANMAADLQRQASQNGIHLLGPNGLGMQRPSLQLNASCAGPLAQPGSLALVSQSGALTASMLDWAANNGVGFSSVVALGSHSGVDIAQVLDFLANDPQTQSIVVYVEGIRNARHFMSALRMAANAKPVVVLKSGRHNAGTQAAQTHSGNMGGSDHVFDAALRRAGAVRVRSFVELFSAAKCLASRYRPVGKRLAVITNGGGPGVLATDWITEIQLELGILSPDIAAELKPQINAAASLRDLIDLSEDATPEHYAKAVQAAVKDRNVDGILVIYSPKPGQDAADIARAVTHTQANKVKPLLTCWMGDSSVVSGRKELTNSTLPSFRTPEAAVGAFGNIASFYQNQQLLQQTPMPMSSQTKADVEGARLVLESVLAERRKVLTEMESKALLSAFQIPVTPTMLARSPTEAMMIATQMGFPVALKIDSPDITHKSDVHGVVLNLTNATSVRDTYQSMVQAVRRHQPDARINGVTVQTMARAHRGREICIGLLTDQPFGPVITFGAGGTMIELIGDHAMELPPLNQFLARRLIERSRVAETLGAWRGLPPASIEALEHILLRVSEMVCELPQLREMDINPLIVDEHGAVAVDARIAIDHAPQGLVSRFHHYHHLAILPYPSQYERTWPLSGGGECTVRPVHPDDAQMLQAMVKNLSDESRYFRFASTIKELPPSMLARFTLIDYDREMALVAVHNEQHIDEHGDVQVKQRIIGVSRYVTNPDQTSCEFSLLVADDFNGRGLGSRLMQSIMDVARDQGLSEIVGLVLSNNPNMLKLMRSLGFSVKSDPDDPDFKIVSHPL